MRFFTLNAFIPRENIPYPNLAKLPSILSYLKIESNPSSSCLNSFKTSFISSSLSSYISSNPLKKSKVTNKKTNKSNLYSKYTT